MAIEAEEEARRQPAPCLADGADLDDIERMFADQDGYSLFQDAPTVAYGLEPIERVALHYRNDPTMCGRSLQDVPPAQLDGLQPSLEIARTPGEDTDLVVFRSVVVDVSGTPDHVILHGDVLLPLRLVQERRSHLKKWDIVTGRMALNHGKLYAAQGHKWVVIHVLRVNCGFRRAFRERAQEEAEREMQSRGLALHAKPRAEVVNPVLQSLARGSSKTSTSEQEAGLIIIRTYDDGKSRFRGVVGLVDEDGEWAVVSSNVFLDFGHVRSRWGRVDLGDVVDGLMVPDRQGGCDWRCIHVTKVDRGGVEVMKEQQALDQQLADEEAALEAKREALRNEDHKAEIEKLKEAMRLKREEERRVKEAQRLERMAARHGDPLAT